MSFQPVLEMIFCATIVRNTPLKFFFYNTNFFFSLPKGEINEINLNVTLIPRSDSIQIVIIA